MKYIKRALFITVLLFINGCGDNTTTPITKDVSNMSIDNGPVLSLYSTDQYNPSATVYFNDGTSATATDNVDWKRSDLSMLYLSNELIILPLLNDGNSTLTAGYKSFQYFENNVTVDIVGLVDLNTSWRISSADVNTTGDFLLEAEGNYTDGTTNKKIVRNIVWTSSNTAIATISLDSNYVVTLTTLSTGDVNITATLFGDTNSSKTKQYTIN